jgi:2-octaprenyl-6-methoxyphenol hydroxylase
MTQVVKDFDIVIAGGGLAGASMALALAPLKLKVAVIEAHPYESGQSQPGFDDRCLALAWSSRQIYQTMGIWPKLNEQEEACAAIKQIHISDRGHAGITRLDHRAQGVPALGYVVESRVLGNVLIDALHQEPGVKLFSPARIAGLEQGDEHVTLGVQMADQALEISTQLLIVADGIQSQTRDLLGIRVDQEDYGQTAVIANVETQQAHQNRAFERFTDTGPLAMLPLTRKRCSLVWTTTNDQVNGLMQLSDEAFKAALQERFGYRLGAVTRVGKRSCYPLSLMKVNHRSVQEGSRVALIGNAAHSVHPVAGQGFNLGLRDIAALAELIAGAYKTGCGDPGDASVLKAYWQWRQTDIRQVSTITDGLIKLFSNNFVPLAVARNAGLLISDLFPALKNAMAREAMGCGLLQGKPSKMSAGQSLF